MHRLLRWILLGLCCIGCTPAQRRELWSATKETVRDSAKEFARETARSITAQYQPPAWRLLVAHKGYKVSAKKQRLETFWVPGKGTVRVSMTPRGGTAKGFEWCGQSGTEVLCLPYGQSVIEVPTSSAGETRFGFRNSENLMFPMFIDFKVEFRPE